MRKFAFPALAACIAAALIVSVVRADHHEGKEAKKTDKKMGKGAKVGEAAPEFTLKDQAGKDVALSDYKGKIVVLEWFNEGCPYVVKFYGGGNMNTWANSFKEKDVVWLAINSTSSSTQESNAKVAADWKIDRPVLNDADTKVAKMYGATNTPHMYVIDKDGKLAYKGAIDDKPTSEAGDIEGATNYVANAVNELQAGTAVSTPETKAYGCNVKYAK